MAEVTDNLQRILETTLVSFVDLVNCDGGAVFTVRKDPDFRQFLKFEAMITRSLDLRGVPEHLHDLQFEIDESTVVGRTAAYRQPIILNLEVDPGQVSAYVAEVLHYQTRNIFSAPLITPRGDLVGVVQLVNKLGKDGESFSSDTPLPAFDAQDERLFSIIVGQSAFAIENSLLLEEQEQLIQGFVNACVTAIEARDPATSGHSVRVATYTVGLAEAVNKVKTGALGRVSFTPAELRELRFASMLHDIGKIGVREELLQKEKKLHPQELEIISMRLKLMRTHMLLRQQTHHEDYTHAIANVDQAWKEVLKANEPSVLHGPASKMIDALRSLQVQIGPEEVLAALTDEEAQRLALSKGTLSDPERLEIENHVEKTFEILKLIPWSRGLEMVPDIAYMHHENMDGTGYPRHVRAEFIPPQARMMAICDIYDALRASDRPYKESLSVDRTLDILTGYVKAGKLDKSYFEIFLQAKVFSLHQSKSGLTSPWTAA